ncbi:CPBP family intramembrane glutamic endopeptidase [Yoonia vestfoldensis]|uniref:CPBP family intramembrane glutamic endopeptidase n=1 Tax=Yoonia vestfoldensis TaxID=245188 RepID=UPI00036D3F01|nr:CPBP family intramembrane glutamic endopeptidase [Yoonia vestfoldensis]
MSDPYRAHAQFIRPAWSVRDAWRVVAMIFLVDLVFNFSPAILALLLSGDALEAYYQGTTAFGTLAQFYSFGVAGLGLVGLLHLLHRRGFWSLIGDRSAAWDDLKRVCWAVGLVLLVVELLPPWALDGETVVMRDPGTWMLLLPLGLLALLVQVGTEEMFFRGYLQQQMACLSSSRWAWMVFPSVLFGVVHFWNGYGPADGLIWAIWAALLGMACADLTARTGNLGAAIGLHLANNAFALLLYAVEDWPASGLALFLYPYEDPTDFDYSLPTLLDPWMIPYALTMAGSVLVMWFAARIAIRR